MSDFGNLTMLVISTILVEYKLGGLLRCTYSEQGSVKEEGLLETETNRHLLKRRHASSAGYMDSPEIIEAVQFFADRHNVYGVASPSPLTGFVHQSPYPHHSCFPQF